MAPKQHSRLNAIFFMRLRFGLQDGGRMGGCGLDGRIQKGNKDCRRVNKATAKGALNDVKY
jgi:hypothetical protein